MRRYSIGLSFTRPLNGDRWAIDAGVDIGRGGVCAEDARHGGTLVIVC